MIEIRKEASAVSTIDIIKQPGDIALEYMRRSPPTDLVGLAAHLGVAIRQADLGSDAGKIERIAGPDGVQYVITLNRADPLNRQRFTLAHELAHFIKHRRHLETGGIVDNALYRSLLPEPLEWEANRYAAMLLMPLSAMHKLWREGLRAPAEFAERLGVSEQAAAIRLGPLRGTLALD